MRWIGKKEVGEKRKKVVEEKGDVEKGKRAMYVRRRDRVWDRVKRRVREERRSDEKGKRARKGKGRREKRKGRVQEKRRTGRRV